MRVSFVLSLSIVLPLTSAVAVPSPPLASSTVASETDVNTGLIEFDVESARAKFGVPCEACLGSDSDSGDDESPIIFEVQAFPSDQACGTSTLTINGQQLSLNWDGTHARGQGKRDTLPDQGTRSLDLSWEVSCLAAAESSDGQDDHDEEVVQVVTVTVQAVDGSLVKRPSGFTMSYRQLGEPRLLRLSTVPDPIAGQSGQSEDWRNPPLELLLEFSDQVSEAEETVSESVASHYGTDNHDVSIEDQIRELKMLNAQAGMLHNLINQKKTLLRSHMRKGCGKLREEIKQCDGLLCIVKALGRHTRDAAKALYAHIKPLDFESEFAPILHPGTATQFPAKTSLHPPTHQNGTRSDLKLPFDLHPAPPTNPLVKALTYAASALGLTALLSFLRTLCCRRSPRYQADRLAAREERRTARAYRRAARRAAWQAWWDRTCPALLLQRFKYSRQQQQQPTDWDEKRARVMAQEHLLESDMQTQLARLREETAMRNELRALRRAHGVVDALVRAEEGHMSPASRASPPPRPQPLPHPRSPPPMTMTPGTMAHGPRRASPLSAPRNGGEGTSRPRGYSATASLPEYRTEEESGSDGEISEPPAYEEDEDVSDVVVDGFREYSPGGTALATGTGSVRDDGDADVESEGDEVEEEYTPESSVVEVSPRPSAETLRTAAADGKC